MCLDALGFGILAKQSAHTLLHHRDEYKADPITVQKVLANPKMKGILSAELLRVDGDKFASGLAYRDLKTNEEHVLPVSGIFVEIGQIPNTTFIDGVVDLTETGTVVTDPRNQRTSTPGIWAAGDCTDGLYHQNNIAAGDAVKALEDIYMFINRSAVTA